MSSTRERIMNESLNLFSEKGYDGVSMRDIAAACGIKAASIYNHFKGKESIFEAILEERRLQYEKEVREFHISGFNPVEDAGFYDHISQDVLVQMGRTLFSYFVHDEKQVKFRRMLTIGQFQNKKLSDIYTKQYYDDVVAYQSGLFGLLIESGVCKGVSPEVMALHFYGPVYTLMVLHDRCPEREAEILGMLEKHIRQFGSMYEK